MKKNGTNRGAAALLSDPSWERMKSSRRLVSHDDAVRETAQLQKQFRLLWSDRMAASPVDLQQILRTLTEKKIRFVLTGAHAIGGWTGRPRNTRDVDILVKAGRNHARAVKAIHALYPQLETRDLTGVTAFFIPGETESVIDVTYPHRADNVETLNKPVWVTSADGLRYRIPSLEAALANKYGAMLSLSRDQAKRAQDAVDFAWMVRHSLDQGQMPIDLDKLAKLGESIWPEGGRKEIIRFVDEAKKGGVPDFRKQP
jgi:hypothetical protein